MEWKRQTENRNCNGIENRKGKRNLLKLKMIVFKFLSIPIYTIFQNFCFLLPFLFWVFYWKWK